MALIIPDPKWEAPELLYPGRKPTAPVEIDWSHPLARGLKICAIPQGKPAFIDLAGGGLSEGSVPVNGGDLVIDSANKVLVNTRPFQNDAYTFLWAGTADAVGSWDAWGGLVALPADAGASSCIAIQRNSTTSELRLYRGINYLTLSTGIGDLATPSVLAVMYDKNVNTVEAHEYLNGIDQGFQNATHSSKTSDSQLGINVERALDVANAASQLFECLYLWDRKLTKQEVKSISKNLYQFLIPA